MEKLRNNTIPERVLNGIIKENPVLVLMLGLTPALAVTQTADGALGLGLTTLAVLVLSNVLVSLFQNCIPPRFQTVTYLMIAAAFVTVAERIIGMHIPELAAEYELGIYLPLIVVNCLVLGRMRTYAAHKNVLLAFFDGLGMGLGFALVLLAIGYLREGAREAVIALQLMPYVEASQAFDIAPTAFFIVAFAVALGNKIRIASERRHVRTKYESGCAMNCVSCGEAGCRERVLPTDITSNWELGAFIVKQGKRAAAFVWFVLKNMGALLKLFGSWLWGQMKKVPPLLAKIPALFRKGDSPKPPDSPDAPTLPVGEPPLPPEKPPEENKNE
jgi:electron transport complex protein RnfE